MIKDLPSDYVISKFYTFVSRPQFKKYANTYIGECCACGEGGSKGRKRRLYYMVDDHYLYCHNCNRSWNEYSFVSEFSGLHEDEILKEAAEFGSFLPPMEQEEPKKKSTAGTLPDDSINLFDKQQLEFYKNNQVVRDALNEVKRRRLDTAINKPRALFISLKDKIHKNRICFPFYDEDNQIQFYQARALYSEDVKFGKYLSKLGADKTIFGIRNIDPSLECLFLFEGPIDSMFVKNGLAVGGIELSNLQEEMISKYVLLDKIWVLDNQKVDRSSRDKTNELIEKGERVFIWPTKFRKFKDVNDLCLHYNIDQISPKFIQDNSYEGAKALLMLAQQ
jgi:hypothetical protein